MVMIKYKVIIFIFIQIISPLMSWGQTQYDYYDSNAVAGGANRALNGIVITAIFVIVAIALLFIVAGVFKINR